MADTRIFDHLESELASIRDAGLFKEERVIVSPQQAAIRVQSGDEVINFCANNYLGLSNHPKVVAAAQRCHRRARLWHVVSALHLWHTGRTQGDSSGASANSSALTTPSCTRRAGTPTAACSRSCSDLRMR